MKFNNEEYGFHFNMDNPNFIALNDEGKRNFFNMDEQQLKYNLYQFVEVENNRLTGRYFSFTLDSGFYPTLEDVKNGQNLCIENVKKYCPTFKLVNESTIMPGNIRNCVWQLPSGEKLSQYYLAKNGYMMCVAGMIGQEHDDLDNLMAFTCMSMGENTREQAEKEKMQQIMFEFTKEINRLVDEEGKSLDEARDLAAKKMDIKLKG